MVCYIRDNKRGYVLSIAPFSFANTPRNAPFQLLLYDYIKDKVQVVCAALDTSYLFLAEPSYLNDFYPKALCFVLLPLSLTV